MWKKQVPVVYISQCCGSGSAWIRNFCLDPELLFRFRIRIQQNMKEEINKNVISHLRPVNSGRFVLEGCTLYSSMEQKMADRQQILLLLIQFKVFFFYNFQIYLNNVGWSRIRMDPELLPGSGTQKVQSWIRNKSFRIRKTDISYNYNGGNSYLGSPVDQIDDNILDYELLPAAHLTAQELQLLQLFLTPAEHLER